MLYPKTNKYREVFSLNGIWTFKTVADDYEPTLECFGGSPMAVPASFNDIVTDKAVKDHEGKVLYETFFSVPLSAAKLYRLRIGATSHI